jgi:hypothetical protein
MQNINILYQFSESNTQPKESRDFSEENLNIISLTLGKLGYRLERKDGRA